MGLKPTARQVVLFGSHICKLCIYYTNYTVIYALRCTTYCYFSTCGPPNNHNSGYGPLPWKGWTPVTYVTLVRDCQYAVEFFLTELVFTDFDTLAGAGASLVLFYCYSSLCLTRLDPQWCQMSQMIFWIRLLHAVPYLYFGNVSSLLYGLYLSENIINVTGSNLYQIAIIYILYVVKKYTWLKCNDSWGTFQQGIL
jgi:hypothetical protein